MLSIAVLAGGTSDEREISLRSGKAVANALTQAGYTVQLVDPADADFNVSGLKSYDTVFIALHGKGGEDGAIQKQLEDQQISFIGSDSKGSDLCFDKWRYYQALQAHDILQPDTELVDFGQFKQSPLSQAPYVLKPNDGGSSIDNIIARDPGSVTQDKLEQVFAKHTKMLLQELINGLEITVAVLGEQALPVIEIIPPANALFDYENKYNGATAEICPPQQLSAELQQQAQQLALQIHHLTGCRDLSRADMIVTDQSQIYVLETNTIPGLSEQSLLPKTAAVAGYGMPELCSWLAQAAYKRKTTA